MIRNFKNRVDAAKQLVPLLEKYRNNTHAIIFGLPRGGMVLAGILAESLHIPLDMFVPRKITHSTYPEVAIGAVTESGEVELSEQSMSFVNVTFNDLKPCIARQVKESQRRQQIYRLGKPIIDLHQKTVIIVDDGIATGFTMKAAIKSAIARGSEKIVVAVPVLPEDRVSHFEALCDELIYIAVPRSFAAVGQFYDEFDQVEDEQVVEIMKKAHQPIAQ